MRISEIYRINTSRHELDFVDVDINVDTPLFLDPYFIAKNDFPIAFNAHLSLRSYFESLFARIERKWDC